MVQNTNNKAPNQIKNKIIGKIIRPKGKGTIRLMMGEEIMIIKGKRTKT